MVRVAAVIGAVSASGGLQAVYWLETSTGPTIVSLAAIVFALASVVDQVRQYLWRRLSGGIAP